MSLSGVQNIILILSGKGGVGKSSITTQLALSLSLQNHSVGILDLDLTGPSMPRLLGLEGATVTQTRAGWLPVTVHGADPAAGRAELRCMSLGFLLRDRGDAVVWRGPKKTAMVRQFLADTAWGELEYLLIDTPPGTSDEHISLAESLLTTTTTTTTTNNTNDGQPTPPKLRGAVIVTTPQAIATADVRKELNFCAKTRIPVLGVVENMSGFVCPSCAECTNVFSSGGGRVMAADFAVPFLGNVPIDPQFGLLVEEGRRPVYPRGTVVGGLELGVAGLEQGQGQEQEVDTNGRRDNADTQTNGENNEEEHNTEKDTGLLVDKYRDCSLHAIFQDITTKMLAQIDEAQ
ncbi:MAG: cytosolic Fe-S cluster assembly factor cfd1 [Sarea resinae]|nr:MAG: cytosolic Fe-S cluster assembly factor cfd1 [Sarea resinae]